MRVSPATIFVGAAFAIVTSVGAAARRAPAPARDTTGLADERAAYGFEPTSRAQGVDLLDATRAFELALGNGPVRGTRARDDRRARARALVTRELERYPRSFLEAIHLRGVVLCGELTEGLMAIPSLPNVGGHMLLDVVAGDEDLARTLHHEVFHFADLADDQVLAPDPAWESLNDGGFTYGAGGRSFRSHWAGRPTDLPGFVSAYATSGVEEDKAETFSFAVTRSDTLRHRLSRDPILTRKLAEVRRRIDRMDPGTAARLGLGDSAENIAIAR